MEIITVTTVFFKFIFIYKSLVINYYESSCFSWNSIFYHLKFLFSFRLQFFSCGVGEGDGVGGAVGVGTEVGVLLGEWVGSVEAGEHKSQHSKPIPHNSHYLRTKGTVLVPKSGLW